MKKPGSAKSRDGLEDDLRPEYSFDYSKAKPNPFAKDLAGRTVAVVLDPDVAEVFPDTRAVNTALRVLASAARRTRTQAPEAGRPPLQTHRTRKAG